MKNNERRYRVRWKSLITGAKGHGTGLFTYEEAKKIADGLNIEHRNLITHWAEVVYENEGIEDEKANN